MGDRLCLTQLQTGVESGGGDISTTTHTHVHAHAHAHTRARRIWQEN